MTFAWHLFGTIGNKCIDADGYGYGAGYRQHHWGKGGKGWGEHGLPNLNWLSPGRVMQACTSSLVSPRELSTHSTSLCPRDSPSRESGGDRMELTGLPPTM